MVKTEFYMTRADGVKLYRTYSTEGLDIRQVETGIVYGEAYTYEEIPADADKEADT